MHSTQIIDDIELNLNNQKTPLKLKMMMKMKDIRYIPKNDNSF